MITDSFLNSCFSVILGQSKIKKNKALYRDIVDIINYSDTKKSIDIPISLKNKIEILNKICEMKLVDKTDDNIIDSLSVSDKYSQIIPVLESKLSEEISDNDVLDHVNQIKLRKKLNSLLTNQDKISKVLNSIKDSSFDSIDDLISDYETAVQLLYLNIMEQNRSAAIESISSIDLRKDDYKPMLNKIIEKYDEVNTTPTGYDLLDTQIFYGGFEKSRLYIFAGCAGTGKSTLLCNLMTNSMKVESDDKEHTKVYVYITLENTIEESFMRLYQSVYNKTKVEALNDIKNGINIQQAILDELEKTNSTIIMKYFVPGTISSTDLMMVLDDTIEEYGRDNIRGLYVDYLDVLKTDIKYDVPWMEIGHIALNLKNLAVYYNIPVITVTHLDRSAYGSDSKNVGLNQMSKSIQKIEHADFIGLMIRDPLDDTIIHVKIGKNRSGQANNISIDFKVDLSKYKYITCFWPNANHKMNDDNSLFSYGGNNLF